MQECAWKHKSSHACSDSSHLITRVAKGRQDLAQHTTRLELTAAPPQAFMKMEEGKDNDK